MVKVKSMLITWGGMVASLALVVGLATTTSACVWWYYQPKVPAGMKKFEK